MNIGKSFQGFRKQYIKSVYKIQIENEKGYFDRCIINKVLKMD